MPVVFEELEPDLGPERGRRRAPRWLPLVAVIAIGVLGALVARGNPDDAVASPPTATPSPSAAVSYVSTVARGEVVTPGNDTVVVDRYSLPGVLTVTGRAGWRFDAASTTDVRRYTALDLATGSLRPTVAFGVADGAPLATVDLEARRQTTQLTVAGASGFTSSLVAFDDTTAADLSYTTASGRYVMERLWLRGGIAVFVRVSDVWAETVTTVFDDTVRFGTVTP